MTQVTIEIINSIRDLSDMPEVLYKYRQWKNELHLRILTQREFFLAPPFSFEDELDCRVPLRYDLMGPEEIEKMGRNVLKGKSEEYIRKDIDDKVKSGFFKRPGFPEHLNEDYYKKQNDRLGIFCVTPYCADLEMWSKYGGDGYGFVVGFDSKMLSEYKNIGSAGQVLYFDEIPEIIPYKDIEDSVFQMQLSRFIKLKKWAFEKEYRTMKFDNNGLKDRVAIVPSDAYREIIFGYKIPEKEIEKEAEHLREQFKNAQLKRAYFNSDTNSIEIRDL